MTEHTRLAQITIILLFVLTFTLIGWASPVIYASNVPEEDVMEVHNFEASNTTTNADQHYVCFDRTVKNSNSGTVFTELYLLTEDGDRVELDSQSINSYFEQGRHNVIVPLTLPNDLPRGEYKYLLTAKMDMADGRVDREFVFESNRFHVTDEEKDTPDIPENC